MTVSIAEDAVYIPAINFTEVSVDPSAPGSGHALLYIKDGVWYARRSGGSPTALGGSVALAENSLAIGDGDGLLSALSPGSEGAVPTRQADGSLAEVVPSAPGGGGDVTKIDTHVVPSNAGAGETTFTWSNIPGTFQHLKIVGSYRNKTDNAEALLNLRFNGDTGNNYDSMTSEVYNGNRYDANYYAQSSIQRVADAMTGSYDGWSIVETLIPNYASTVIGKATMTKSTRTDQASNNYFFQMQNAGKWRATSAITSITLFVTADAMLPGSAFTLYGLA